MYRCQRGAANAFVPFAVILILATLAVGGFACFRVNEFVNKSMNDRTGALTKTLAAALGDPFAMGEYDHMQRIIDAAKAADPDVQYAIVVTTDGKAIATTDPNVKDVNLDRNAFEKDALTAKDYMWRKTDKSNVWEAVMPITSAGGSAGVLRVGESTERASGMLMEMVIVTLIICACAVVVGLILLSGVAKKAAAAS